MGIRVYSTYFDAVTVAAVQDLFNVLAAAGNPITLHEINISAGAVTAPAEIRLRLKRHGATVTQGSGGTTPVKSATDSKEPSSSATVHANDTTQGTTSGSSVTLMAWQWQVLNPFLYLPSPEDRERIQGGEALIVDIAATPASTVITGCIKWEET